MYMKDGKVKFDIRTTLYNRCRIGDNNLFSMVIGYLLSEILDKFMWNLKEGQDW